MTVEEMQFLAPVIRLVTGLEMAAYREKVLDSLSPDRADLPESKAIAAEYNTALDIFALYFPKDIQ